MARTLKKNKKSSQIRSSMDAAVKMYYSIDCADVAAGAEGHENRAN